MLFNQFNENMWNENMFLLMSSLIPLKNKLTSKCDSSLKVDGEKRLEIKCIDCTMSESKLFCLGYD